MSNRPDWLKDPVHWQNKTRDIEDSLSDALHERLTLRFVDRRTSALMKGMRDKDELNADIAEDGAITVENHFVGRLKGFRFTLDAADDGMNGKATRQAATQVVTRELGMRARRVSAAQNDAFKLTRDGRILWRDDEVATLEAADDPLQPTMTLLADEHLGEADRDKVTARLQTWLKDLIADKLKPLAEMSNATDLQGLARGIAFRLKENFGVLKRDTVADEINALDQTSRADLRKYGLRFGAFNIFFPPMLKPASADLAATLWLLKSPAAAGADAAVKPQLPRPGLTSAATDPATPEALYRAYGFHVCGPRAVRLDILERLADQIRPLLAWRSSPEKTDAPPKGSTGDGGFKATEEMMSILGCSAAELGVVLTALGFRLDRRPVATPAVSAVVAPAPASVESASEIVSESSEVLAALETSTDATAAEPVAAITAPSEASPNTPPDTSSDTPSAASADAIQYEDVWRPRRHPRSDRGNERAQPRENRRGNGPRRDRNASPPIERPAAVTAGAAATAAATTDSPSPRPERERGPRPNRDAARDRRPTEANRTDASRTDASRTNTGPNRDRGERDRPRGPGAGRPSSGPRDRDREKGRRDDHRRQPEVISAAPPKRSAGLDPDSPFAKLAALKASMDKRGEGPGSR